jgi:hypothetical protein
MTVTPHIPPEPRSSFTLVYSGALVYALTIVFISVMFLDGIAAMKKVAVTSAPEIGLWQTTKWCRMAAGRK